MTLVEPLQDGRAGVLGGVGVIALDRCERFRFGRTIVEFSHALGAHHRVTIRGHVERGASAQTYEQLAIAPVDVGDELGQRYADDVG